MTRNVSIYVIADPLNPDAQNILQDIVNTVGAKHDVSLTLLDARVAPFSVASQLGPIDAVLHFKGPGTANIAIPSPHRYVETISIPQLMAKAAAVTMVEAALESCILGVIEPYHASVWNNLVRSDLTKFDLNAPIALDIETAGNIKTITNVSNLPIINVAMYQPDPAGAPRIFNLHHSDFNVYESYVDHLANLFTMVKYPIVHNGKFDLRVIEKQTGVRMNMFADTMLMHHVLNQAAGVHGLKPLARMYLGAPDWEAGIKSHIQNDDYGTIPKAQLVEYNINDVLYTYHLYEYFMERMDEVSMKALMLEMSASEMLMDVEEFGFKVDVPYLMDLGKSLQIAINGAKTALRSITNNPKFNPASPKQVKDFLASEGIHVPTTTESELRTMQPAMGQKASNFVNELLIYRRLAKGNSTYVESVLEKVDEDDRVHTTFLIHGTSTGRLSSSGPNIQNIPRDATYRGAFIG